MHSDQHTSVSLRQASVGTLDFDSKETTLDMQQLRPCSCGATELLVANAVPFTHVAGSSNHYFDVVVCSRCKRTDLFATDLDDWVRKGAQVVRFTPR